MANHTDKNHGYVDPSTGEIAQPVSPSIPVRVDRGNTSWLDWAIAKGGSPVITVGEWRDDTQRPEQVITASLLSKLLNAQQAAGELWVKDSKATVSKGGASFPYSTPDLVFGVAAQVFGQAGIVAVPNITSVKTYIAGVGAPLMVAEVAGWMCFYEVEGGGVMVSTLYGQWKDYSAPDKAVLGANTSAVKNLLMKVLLASSGNNEAESGAVDGSHPPLGTRRPTQRQRPAAPQNAHPTPNDLLAQYKRELERVYGKDGAPAVMEKHKHHFGVSDLSDQHLTTLINKLAGLPAKQNDKEV